MPNIPLNDVVRQVRLQWQIDDARAAATVERAMGPRVGRFRVLRLPRSGRQLQQPGRGGAEGGGAGGGGVIETGEEGGATDSGVGVLQEGLDFGAG